MWNFIRKLGLALGVFYIVLIAITVIFDGQVFEFSNHTLEIYDSGFHLKSKSE